MLRILLFLGMAFGFARPALADDVARAGRGVVRIVTAVELADGRSGSTLGSGFAVSRSHIVTNYHVVQLYDSFAGVAQDAIIAVVPSEGSRPYPARLVQTNPSKDLALLELIGTTLPPLRLFSGPIEPGQIVTALGYPNNVDVASAQSVRDFITPAPVTRSGGEYSSSRSINGIDAYLHDAVIARGSSGGPLVDRCGRVLGVNTFITRGDDGDGTFAFAVSNDELAAFLGPWVATETGPCVTSEERQQRHEQAVEAGRERARADCDTRNAAAEDKADATRRDAEENARQGSDTRLFASLVVLVVGGLGLGAAGILYTQKQQRGAIACAAAGGCLMIAAVVVFVTRGGSGPVASPAPRMENCESIADQAGKAIEDNLSEPADEEEAASNAM